jgi:SAM-dependent methyltransferase
VTELEYHERLYSGFAQRHFARPAVRALRRHMARRIVEATGAGPRSRVLSLGCGIGDTELALAPMVGEVVGLDLSPSAIRQARADSAAAGVRNAQFVEGTEIAETGFDAVIAIFFLHHLRDPELRALPARVLDQLTPEGVFYSLDPSRYRLAGAIGRIVAPRLMERYHSPDERELEPGPTARLFREAGFETRQSYYDFVSTPLAGVFPGWEPGYRAARALDEVLIRVPFLRTVSSNFEVTARKRAASRP